MSSATFSQSEVLLISCIRSNRILHQRQRTIKRRCSSYEPLIRHRVAAAAAAAAGGGGGVGHSACSLDAGRLSLLF